MHSSLERLPNWVSHVSMDEMRAETCSTPDMRPTVAVPGVFVMQ